MARELAGYYPIMATAFREDGEVDLESMRRLTGFLVENGAQGMSPNGGDSEGPRLTVDERNRILDVVVEECAGRAGVLAGGWSKTVDDAIAVCRYASQTGADALFVHPPQEWENPTQDQLYGFYASICDAIEIPLMIHAARGMDVGFMNRLLEHLPNVEYIKEETSFGRTLRQYVRELGDRVTVFGPGLHYVAELEWGAMGVMPSCCAPRAHSLVFDLFQEGRKREAEDMWHRMLALVFWRWHTSAQEAGKEFLKHMGIFETTYCRSNDGKRMLEDADREEMLRILKCMGGPPY